VNGKLNQEKVLHEIGSNAADKARSIEIEEGIRTSNEVKMFSFESTIAATNN
jgi:hypothetical protein